MLFKTGQNFYLTGYLSGDYHHECNIYILLTRFWVLKIFLCVPVRVRLCVYTCHYRSVFMRSLYSWCHTSISFLHRTNIFNFPAAKAFTSPASLLSKTYFLRSLWTRLLQLLYVYDSPASLAHFEAMLFTCIIKTIHTGLSWGWSHLTTRYHGDVSTCMSLVELVIWF